MWFFCPNLEVEKIQILTDELWLPKAHQAPFEKNEAIHLESRDVSL